MTSTSVAGPALANVTKTRLESPLLLGRKPFSKLERVLIPSSLGGKEALKIFKQHVLIFQDPKKTFRHCGWRV